MNRDNCERGFSLPELITVLSITSMLVSLALLNLRDYRQHGANIAARHTVRDAITDVEGALNNVEHVYSTVTFTQSTPGPLLHPDARAALSTFYVPANQSFSVELDPDCDSHSCTQVFLLSQHCQGNATEQYLRLGDGVSVAMEVASAGC